MAKRDQIQVAGLTARPGERSDGIIEVTRRLDGSTCGVPLIILHGVEEGPTMVLDGGVHGDEAEGVLAVQRLCAGIDPTKLSGTIIASPAVNYLAVEGMERATPQHMTGTPGSTDLNRVFPGRSGGSLTERFADVYVTEVLSRADLYITMHGGGGSFMGPPKVLFDNKGDDIGAKNIELARAFGWDILWENTGGYEFRGASSGLANQMDVPAIVPESAGSDRMPTRHSGYVQDFVSGIENALVHYDMLDGEASVPRRWLRCANEFHVHVECDGVLWYDPDIDLRSSLKEGERIATVVDVLGREIDEVLAPWDGYVILLRTYPVVRAGDWIVSLTRDAYWEEG